MAVMSLCGRFPKPFGFCKDCYRNPMNTNASPLQSYIKPDVGLKECAHYIPLKMTVRKPTAKRSCTCKNPRSF